jgi:hypothetical protein
MKEGGGGEGRKGRKEGDRGGEGGQETFCKAGIESDGF